MLPVLACNELVMSSDAKIGDVAGPNGKIPEEDIKEYMRTINAKSKEAVVLKMLDKSVVVVAGLEDRRVVYVDASKVGQPGTPFVSDQNKAKPVLPGGSIGLYNVEQAMRYGLCEAAVETREAVADKYESFACQFAQQ